MELSGPGGRPVKGNRHTPLVRMLRENVIGRPEKWNKKNGEGKIREIDENTGLSKASVYVYHTSLHFSPQQLDIQDKNLLRFNIVECKEYGKIAQFVRVHHPPSSPRQAETPHSPASPRQSEAIHPPRNPRKDKTKTIPGEADKLFGNIIEWDLKEGRGRIQSVEAVHFIFKSAVDWEVKKVSF